jgi:hypothetical protein
MRAVLLVVGVEILILAAIGCAVGPEQEPGCHGDTDCGEGWICRAGACFQATPDVADGGDSGDG